MRDIESKADEIRRWRGKGMRGIPLPSYDDLAAFLGRETDTAAMRYMQELFTAFWDQLVLYETLFDQLADFQLRRSDMGENMWMYFCPFCEGEESAFANFFVHRGTCIIQRVQTMRKRRQEKEE